MRPSKLPHRRAHVELPPTVIKIAMGTLHWIRDTFLGRHPEYDEEEKVRPREIWCLRMARPSHPLIFLMSGGTASA